jgi:hypothetical protein
MLPDEFVHQTAKFWSEYLQQIQRYAHDGRLSASMGCRTYFPNILICTETPDIFLAELVGVQERFDRFLLKRRRQSCAGVYVNQFPLPEDPGVRLTRGNQLTGVCIGHSVDISALQQRFPIVELFPTRILVGEGASTGAAIQFANGFESAQIRNSVIVNRLGPLFRAKHVLLLTMISRGLSPSSYRAFLSSMLDDIVSGVHTVPPQKEKDYVVAGQFQNMYLAPKLRETTIGDFLNTHPSILLRGFSARRYVYEPHLPWIESAGAHTESAINPDLILEREDERYDVYDLKTAALDRASLTKGPRSRRRFIDYVEEGIAQLANYGEYFAFAKNREYAQAKYNISVEHPQLTLVVGSFENANPEEITEASRKLKHITLIDYDTLTQLFLAAPGE